MINKTISFHNSYYNNLDKDELFTGMIENVAQYKNIMITIQSNVKGIIEIYFGSNYNNMVKTDTFTFTPNKDKNYNIECKNKLFYLKYKNGNNKTNIFNMEVSYNGSNDSMEMLLANTFKKQFSINNSSNILLKSNETFEGGIDNIDNYRSIIIIITCDVPSMIDGLKIYFGQSKDNMILSHKYSYNEMTQKIYTLNCYNSFFKLTYMNGDTDQNIFNINVIYDPIAYICPDAVVVHEPHIQPINAEQKTNINIPNSETKSADREFGKIENQLTESNNYKQKIIDLLNILVVNNIPHSVPNNIQNIEQPIIIPQLDDIYAKLDDINNNIENINIKKIDNHIQSINNKLTILNEMIENKNDADQTQILSHINNNIINTNNKLTNMINDLSASYEENVKNNIILNDMHNENKEIIYSLFQELKNKS